MSCPTPRSLTRKKIEGQKRPSLAGSIEVLCNKVQARVQEFVRGVSSKSEISIFQGGPSSENS